MGGDDQRANGSGPQTAPSLLTVSALAPWPATLTLTLDTSSPPLARSHLLTQFTPRTHSCCEGTDEQPVSQIHMTGFEDVTKALFQMWCFRIVSTEATDIEAFKSFYPVIFPPISFILQTLSHTEIQVVKRYLLIERHLDQC